MPKIIENLPERLLEETHHQLQTVGYSGLTIRSVAKACGVGVGTVYNYFPSKEALLATYLLTDWNVRISAIRAISDRSASAEPVAHCVYDQLRSFAGAHASIFRSPDAAGAFAGAFGRYHGLLRSQIAAPLRKFCSDDFTADFLAESLLTWTMSGKPFDAIYGVIKNLF